MPRQIPPDLISNKLELDALERGAPWPEVMAVRHADALATARAYNAWVASMPLERLTPAEAEAALRP